MKAKLNGNEPDFSRQDLGAVELGMRMIAPRHPEFIHADFIDRGNGLEFRIFQGIGEPMYLNLEAAKKVFPRMVEFLMKEGVI